MRSAPASRRELGILKAFFKRSVDVDINGNTARAAAGATQGAHSVGTAVGLDTEGVGGHGGEARNKGAVAVGSGGDDDIGILSDIGAVNLVDGVGGICINGVRPFESQAVRCSGSGINGQVGYLDACGNIADKDVVDVEIVGVVSTTSNADILGAGRNRGGILGPSSAGHRHHSKPCEGCGVVGSTGEAHRELLSIEGGGVLVPERNHLRTHGGRELRRNQVLARGGCPVESKSRASRMDCICAS